MSLAFTDLCHELELVALEVCEVSKAVRVDERAGGGECGVMR